MIRCITFDLDDTLWECKPVIARAERRLHQWLDRHYPRITRRRGLEAMIDHRTAYMRRHPELHHDLTRLRKQWLGELASEAGYDHSLVEPGFRVFWEARNEVQPFQEALEALESLGGLYVIGAITNGNADVHHIGIGHHFDFVVRAEEAGAAKPHPQIFRKALEQAGCEAGQAVHVGDDPERDVLGAQAVGMRTVWVNPRGVAWTGEGGPDATVRGLEELEGVIAGLGG